MNAVCMSRFAVRMPSKSSEMFSEFLTRGSNKNRQDIGVVRTMKNAPDAVWPVHQGCLYTRLPVDGLQIRIVPQTD